MDYKEIYNENDSFEQAMHDSLVMIGMTIVDLHDDKLTPPQALTLVDKMITTFADYANNHVEDEEKYHRNNEHEEI